MLDETTGGWPLQGGFGDRHQVWEFVRSLAASFGRALTDSDGRDAVEIDEAESRLGFTLPTALREAHMLFGRRRDLTSTQDTLLAPHRLYVDSSGSVLVFRDECQGCSSWGVRLTDLDHDDPPAVMEVGNAWVPYSDRLSVAMAEMTLLESMLSDFGEQNTDNRQLDDVSRAALDSGFERLGLPDLPFWAGPDGPGIRWFQGSDVVLRDDGGAWLWVHGRSPAAVDAVRKRLPGDWQMAGVDDDEQRAS